MDDDFRRAYRRAHRNPNVPPRPCEVCQQTFTPKRRTSITCSRKCYKVYHYRMHKETLSCKHCLAPFTSSLHLHGFCSEACRDAYRLDWTRAWKRRKTSPAPLGRHERKQLGR